MFQKLFMANRDDIAVRIMRACADMGIHAVAVCADADRHALHGKQADEA
jgi:acetyl/propionyl-CoA carboxylase alpha subunit